MNLKKIGGSLAAAVCTLGLTSAASAAPYFDCPGDVPDRRGDTVAELQAMATALRCKDWTEATGTWIYDPIWQWKGGKNKQGAAMGCEVHSKLAMQLHEVRTEEPPPRKKGNNVAKGAANDLEDHKDGSAIDHLTSFIDTILYHAKLNAENDTAGPDADDFVASADEARTCIGSPGSL